MINLSLSVAGLYLETVLYITVSIIVLMVLIIELSVWFSSTRAKQVATHVTNTLEMSIDCSPETTPSNLTPQKTSKKAEASKEISLTAAAASGDPSVSHKSCSYDRLLPICTYVLYLINLNAQFFGRFAVGINRDCYYTAVGGFFYMAAKCCLYLVLLYRLNKVYCGTIFQKESSVKRLKFAAIFTVICAIFIAVANVLTLEKVVVVIGDIRICNNMTHPALFLLFVVYDLILNIGCCIAFTRPLLWLTKMSQRKGSRQNSIYSTVVRYTVITFVTVTTTFLVMAVAVVLQMNDIAFVDIAINSVCVMLFNRSYLGFYHCCCCGAHKMGHALIQMQCCCGSQKSDEKDDQTSVTAV
eukprot:454941_1